MQYADRQAISADYVGAFDEIYTVTSDAENLVLQKAFKQKGLTLYMLSGDCKSSHPSSSVNETLLRCLL